MKSVVIVITDPDLMAATNITLQPEPDRWEQSIRLAGRLHNERFTEARSALPGTSLVTGYLQRRRKFHENFRRLRSLRSLH
jgi:hypothetical protein